jgi:DNA-binding PadR family transcriptional regulator
MHNPKSLLEFNVLHSLSKGSKSGYTLMQQLEKNIGKKPSPGSMYPLLMKLKKHGFVTVKESGKKKIYTITAKGRKEFKKLHQHKHYHVEHMKQHVKMLEHMTGHKQTDVLKMFDKLKKGRMPFLWLFPDALKLRKAMLGTAERVTGKQKREKVKKIVRRTVKELQKV